MKVEVSLGDPIKFLVKSEEEYQKKKEEVEKQYNQVIETKVIVGVFTPYTKIPLPS